MIHCLGSSCCTVYINTFLKNLLQLLLTYMEVYLQCQEVVRIASIYKT